MSQLKIDLFSMDFPRKIYLIFISAEEYEKVDALYKQSDVSMHKHSNSDPFVIRSEIIQRKRDGHMKYVIHGDAAIMHIVITIAYVRTQNSLFPSPSLTISRSRSRNSVYKFYALIIVQGCVAQCT